MTPVADRNIPQFYQPRTPFSTSTFCILQCLHRLVSVWFWSRMIFCTLVLTTVNIMINPCCGSHVPDVSFLAAQYEFNVASWDPIRNIPPGPKLHISKIVQITVPKSKTYLFFWYSLPKKTYVHQFAEKPRLCPCADPRRHYEWLATGTVLAALADDLPRRGILASSLAKLGVAGQLEVRELGIKQRQEMAVDGENQIPNQIPNISKHMMVRSQT